MSLIASLRLQTFHRQGGRCCYCGVRMWLASPSELPGILENAGELDPATAVHGGAPDCQNGWWRDKYFEHRRSMRAVQPDEAPAPPTARSPAL